MHAPSGSLEWLSSNDLGSFALGCVDRRLRRKYHSLLTVREPGKGRLKAIEDAPGSYARMRADTH